MRTPFGLPAGRNPQRAGDQGLRGRANRAARGPLTSHTEPKIGALSAENDSRSPPVCDLK